MPFYIPLTYFFKVFVLISYNVPKKVLFVLSISILLLSGFVLAYSLPTVSGSTNTWGTELNNFLSVTLNSSTGYLNYFAINNSNYFGSSVINTTHIALSNITAGLIAPGAVNATHLDSTVFNNSINATNLTTANFTINSTLGTSITGLQVGTGTCGSAVTFPVRFNSVPLVFCNAVNVTAGFGVSCTPSAPAVTGFTPSCTFGGGASGAAVSDTTNSTVWIAIQRVT